MTDYKEEITNYSIWQPLLLSIIMIIGMVVGYQMNAADDPPLIQGLSVDDKEAIRGSGRVEEIIRFVDTRYVDEVDDNKLVESAISAVLNQLDPHSIYIAPEYMENITNNMEGKFKGVGIETYYLNDTVNVISVLPNSPAEKAGLEKFDQILAINDSIVAGYNIPFDSISQMIRKQESSKDFLVKKYNTKTNKHLAMYVDDIPLNSVDISYMIDDNTGLIKIDRFSSKTYKEFMSALEDLVENHNLKNLIIDLRDNPGGYLPETTNILSQLMKEKDRLLVYTKGKANDRIEYRTTGKNFFSIDKIAVIVNESSASGSEIMAGAIQDWDRGLVVGRRTFGKGLVQEQYPLSNHGAIRLTVARYYTPTGRSIQRSYEDLTDYNDVHSRIDSDTLETIDTVKYYTRILNREVYGSGGIYPDVYIPIVASDEDPGLKEILAKIPEWTYIQLRDNTITDIPSKSDILDWTLPSDYLELFNSYIQENESNYPKGYTMIYDQEIGTEIKSQIAKIMYGKQMKSKIDNKHNTEVNAAYQYIKSELSLEDYLSTIDY